MLKNPDIDVVYLCIPNVLHADAALRCLRAGKLVLCEKPATVSAAEMEQIIRTAAQTQRVFLLQRRRQLDRHLKAPPSDVLPRGS